MATSIHIPQPLLEAVDRKARALKISRNRLIVRALERELASGSDWSPGFFEQLSAVDSETAVAVDNLLASVHQARTRGLRGICEIRPRHERSLGADERRGSGGREAQAEGIGLT